jgi:hypothetical protein
VREPENKLDEELSSLTFGRNTPEFAHILTYRVVRVLKQLVVASHALGVCAFLAVLLQEWPENDIDCISFCEK